MSICIINEIRDGQPIRLYSLHLCFHLKLIRREKTEMVSCNEEVDRVCYTYLCICALFRVKVRVSKWDRNHPVDHTKQSIEARQDKIIAFWIIFVIFNVFPLVSFVWLLLGLMSVYCIHSSWSIASVLFGYIPVSEPSKPSKYCYAIWLLILCGFASAT